MSIAVRPTVTLACDLPNCLADLTSMGGLDVAVSLARVLGWRISDDGTDARCPRHEGVNGA